MPYKNKDDANAQKKRWRARNKEVVRIIRKREYKKNIRIYAARKAKSAKKNAEWFYAYRATLKCSRCPESDPCCLDFHHVHGGDSTVSRLAYKARHVILAEIAKCIVLCANCHRKEHHRLKHESLS